MPTRCLVRIGLVALAVMLTTTTADAGPVRRREARQHARIQQGADSGALTRGETRVLRREQRNIEHLRRHALADGRIGPREARGLDAAQDQASRDIYRLKHNQRTAGGER